MNQQGDEKTQDSQARQQPQADTAAPQEDNGQTAQPDEPEPDQAGATEPTATESAEEAPAAQADTIPADALATVEAILFSADKPLPAGRISEIGELGGAKVVRETIKLLNGRYEQVGSSFRIREIAGGFQMQTLPEYADVLARLVKNRTESKLSQAALETLAIIAYRQPVLRADVESIRGVACGEVLRTLMERNLVRITGRAEEIGRPMLYGTTRYFLEVFGLASLEDLPNAEQLRRPPEKKAQPTQQTAAAPPPADQKQAQATPASAERVAESAESAAAPSASSGIAARAQSKTKADPGEKAG
jgi:segregation and condensation protein B